MPSQSWDLPSSSSVSSPTIQDIRSARAELARLEAERRTLGQVIRQNQSQQHALSLSLTVLRRGYDELRDCLRWLEQADRYDLEDRQLEVVRLDDWQEREATRCPFTADMIHSAPLLRLQAVERAEFDNLLAGSPWSGQDDARLRCGVLAAARKGVASELLQDRHFQGDPLEVAATTSDADLLRFAGRYRPAEAEDREAEVDLDERLDWTLVASFLPNRNQEECRTRWMQVGREGVRTSAWSNDEVARLQELVAAQRQRQGQSQPQSNRPTNWESLATELATGRTGYACFVAYCRRPRDSALFSIEDDEALRSLYDLFAGSWRILALHHPAAKSKAQLYGRFVRSIDPGMTRGKWTREEDEILIRSVAEVGQSDWLRISSRIRGRTSGQCRDRYKNRLEHRLQGSSRQGASDRRRKRKWTEEESSRLRSMLTSGLQPPPGQTWAEVASRMQVDPGVSGKQARDRAETMRKEAERGADGRRLTAPPQRDRSEKPVPRAVPAKAASSSRVEAGASDPSSGPSDSTAAAAGVAAWATGVAALPPQSTEAQGPLPYGAGTLAPPAGAEAAAQAPLKRKRGRPPKRPEDRAPKKRRTRPKREGPPKKRGRPPKKKAAEGNEEMASRGSDGRSA